MHPFVFAWVAFGGWFDGSLMGRGGAVVARVVTRWWCSGGKDAVGCKQRGFEGRLLTGSRRRQIKEGCWRLDGGLLGEIKQMGDCGGETRGKQGRERGWLGTAKVDGLW
ncbi:hypothetical protein DCAR_0729085 [Daucus carota subsp. sativus]|uniref:Uncharacterized protein n=1 Tax=Daucus carota subsp. sativus TaxID=79200 RepID=A0A161Y789_DAUCS|nr:hypothetical protein DCAR_0729085 [Daucus carota subsp. sativus]